MSKKRRKIELLSLPGQVAPQQNPFQQNDPEMEVDNADDKNASAAKWPGKRGGRAPKD